METSQPEKKISYRIIFITNFSSFFVGAISMYLFLKYFIHSL